MPIVTDPSRVFKTGRAAMAVLPKPCSLLSGAEEAALYHDAGAYGFFSLLWCELHRNSLILPARHARQLPKVQKSYRLSELPRVIEGLDPERDTWISQAEFIRPNRRVIYLLRLSLCFVDLDYYKAPWKTYQPDEMANILRGFCQDEGIPDPSLILFSGRGLQVK